MLSKEILTQVTDKILSMDYGDTITHQELAAEFGFRPKTVDYRSAISKLKRECLERGKGLRSIHNVGYQIIPPGDYSDQALKCFKQGAKRITQGDKVLRYAPTEKMNQDELSEYRHIEDRYKMLVASVSGANVEMRLLRKRNPLRDCLAK